MSTALNESESDAAIAPAEAEVQESASPVAASSHNPAPAITSPVSPASSTRSLKRTAEMMQDEDDRQDNKRKRLSEANEGPEPSTSKTTSAPDNVTNADRLVEEIGLELSCGCCSALCYNPVIVLPCQHYYCGSCYTLWTRQSGVNCPSCRTPVTSILPSRAIQSLIDVYLRSVPSGARLDREKEQADEIYSAGQHISVPAPRPRSPDIVPPIDNDAYYRPCPHCPATNDFNWACPDPIIDPSADPSRARLLTDSIPTGHAKCGNCEHLHAKRAPSTSQCDFCHRSFCGLVSPTRCHAKRINEARPSGMENLMDILGNSDVYDAFAINAVEFDYMLDYLREHDINPRFIYSEIVDPIMSAPDGWRPLLDRGLFPAVTEQANAEPVPPPTNPPAEGTDRPASPDRQNTDPPVVEPTPTTAETPDQEMSNTETAPPAVDSSAPAAATAVSDGLVHPSTTTGDDSTAVSPTVVASTDIAPSTSNEMVIDSTNATETPAVIEPRPPTPLVVPERQPTPPILHPEPVLDALPVDVILLPDTVTPPVPVPVSDPASAPAPSADPQVVIVASEDGGSNHSSDDESSHSQGDEPSEEPSSSPPAPITEPFRGPQLHKICRDCACQVFFWGARGWWIKERAKAVDNGDLPEEVSKRKDCENIGNCSQEFDNSHAREFNHIPNPLSPPAGSGTTAAASNPTEEPTPAEATPPPPPDSEDSSQTTINEARPERPEHSSRPASPAPERMDVDPPAPSTTVTSPPVSTEVDGTGDHEMAAPALPEVTSELPNTSQASGSTINTLSNPFLASSTPIEEYSEKMEPTHIGNGDIRMASREESDAPIPVTATTTPTT